MKILIGPLKRIYKRFQKEGSWCQEAPARTESKAPVGYLNSLAQSWCMTGAIRLETADGNPHIGEAIENLIRKTIKKREGLASIIIYNDTPGRKRQEILDIIKEAIESIGGTVDE